MFAVVHIHILCIYVLREDKCYSVVVDKNTLLSRLQLSENYTRSKGIFIQTERKLWQHPAYTWNINKKTTRKKLMSVTHVKWHLRQVVTFYVLPNFISGNTWYWQKEMVIHDVTFICCSNSYIFYDTLWYVYRNYYLQICWILEL